jgi:squalene synthase HpnC
VRAISACARTADDLADEGDAPPAQRLAALAAYRAELRRVAVGASCGERWRSVFRPLGVVLRTHALPTAPFEDLLDAFEQDVHNPCYADRAALLDYCRRSANPVGRLLLHLYAIDDTTAQAQSDAICSALQLINLWQDLGVDAARGRHYVPQVDAIRHGVTRDVLVQGRDTPATRALVRGLCAWADALLRSGAPLVHRVPGRAGFELRLVVQGGLRILEKIARMDHSTLGRRPTLVAAEAPLLLWRAARMRASPLTAEGAA